MQSTPNMSSRVDSVQAIPPFWEPYSESVPLVPSGDPEIGFPYSTVAIAPATRTPSQLFASMPHPSPAYATLYPNLSISENQFYRRPDDHLTHASARSTQGFRMDDTTSSQQDHSCIHDRNYYSETDILSIVTGGNRTLSVPVGYRQSVPDSDDGQGASLDNVMKPTKFIAFSPNSKPTASSSRKNPRPRASRSRTEMPRPISDRAKHGCITCRVRQKVDNIYLIHCWAQPLRPSLAEMQRGGSWTNRLCRMLALKHAMLKVFAQRPQPSALAA